MRVIVRTSWVVAAVIACTIAILLYNTDFDEKYQHVYVESTCSDQQSIRVVSTTPPADFQFRSTVVEAGTGYATVVVPPGEYTRFTLSIRPVPLTYQPVSNRRVEDIALRDLYVEDEDKFVFTIDGILCDRFEEPQSWKWDKRDRDAAVFTMRPTEED